jgi:hypothetical protein
MDRARAGWRLRLIEPVEGNDPFGDPEGSTRHCSCSDPESDLPHARMWWGSCWPAINEIPKLAFMTPAAERPFDLTWFRHDG